MKSNRYKKNNEGVSAVRKQLGLSQEEFAEILLITRSALAMNENRRRPLCGPALLKVAQLELKLASTATFNITNQEPHPNEQTLCSGIIDKSRLLLTKESKCRNQAIKLTAKRTAITDIYKRTRHWLHIIDNTLNEGNFPLHTEERWWKTQKHFALEKLATCDASVQMLIQSQIDQLIGEAELSKKIRLQLTGN